MLLVIVDPIGSATYSSNGVRVFMFVHLPIHQLYRDHNVNESRSWESNLLGSKCGLVAWAQREAIIDWTAAITAKLVQGARASDESQDTGTKLDQRARSRW